MQVVGQVDLFDPGQHVGVGVRLLTTAPIADLTLSVTGRWQIKIHTLTYENNVIRCLGCQ